MALDSSNVSTNGEFDLAHFITIIRKRAGLFGSVVLVTVLCFSVCYLILPKKFKSSSQLTIYSQYFQNPLIRDFVSEQYDPTEMKSQREAVLRQSIDDTFIDEVASKFDLYRTDASNPRRSVEREALRKRFEIYTLNSDTFQLSFTANNAQAAQDVANMMLKQVTDTLVGQRRKSLTNVRDAIRARMEAMVLFKSEGPGGISYSSRAQLEAQIADLNARIHSLLTQYTDRHPKIVRLRARVEELEGFLKAFADSQAGQAQNLAAHMSPDALANAEVEPGSKEIYQDLLKKYNYLNVALDMEQASGVNYYAVISEPTYPNGPFAPNLFNLVTYGLGAGLLLALFVLLYDEYVAFNGVPLAQDQTAMVSGRGVPILGSMPVLNQAPTVAEPSAPLTRNQPNDWN
jgi:uncharacterized protein involved in exopolysaccharide biosynthesis